MSGVCRTTCASHAFACVVAPSSQTVMALNLRDGPVFHGLVAAVHAVGTNQTAENETLATHSDKFDAMQEAMQSMTASRRQGVEAWQRADPCAHAPRRDRSALASVARTRPERRGAPPRDNTARARRSSWGHSWFGRSCASLRSGRWHARSPAEEEGKAPPPPPVIARQAAHSHKQPQIQSPPDFIGLRRRRRPRRRPAATIGRRPRPPRRARLQACLQRRVDNNHHLGGAAGLLHQQREVLQRHGGPSRERLPVEALGMVRSPAPLGAPDRLPGWPSGPKPHDQRRCLCCFQAGGRLRHQVVHAAPRPSAGGRELRSHVGQLGVRDARRPRRRLHASGGRRRPSPPPPHTRPATPGTYSGRAAPRFQQTSLPLNLSPTPHRQPAAGTWLIVVRAPAWRGHLPVTFPRPQLLP